MKIRKMFSIVVTILITIVLAYPSVSMAASNQGKTEKKLPAYCCENGKITQGRMTRSELMKNTNCSNSQSKVKKYCGVCCKNGKTNPVSSNGEKKICQKKEGRFYEKPGSCKAEAVYCCIKGKVKKTSSAECKRYSGKAYKTSSEASRQCKPKDIYCCVNGKIKKTSPAECKKYSGKAYKTSSEASRQCKPEDIYCCVKGKIKKTSPSQCKKYSGKSYKTSSEARIRCKSEPVYCCLNGKVKKLSERECRKNNGTVYLTSVEARQKCSEKGNRFVNKKFKKDRKITPKEGISVNNMAIAGKGIKHPRLDLPVAHMKNQTRLVPVDKIKGISPSMTGLGNVPEGVVKEGSIPWLQFDAPSSRTTITSREVLISYTVSPAIDHAKTITFTLMHGSDSLGQIERLYRRDTRDAWMGIVNRQQFSWFNLPVSVDDSNYRIMATTSGEYAPVISQPFRVIINLHDIDIDCFISDTKADFYNDEILRFNCTNTRHTQMENCSLFMVDGLEMIRVPVNCDSGSTTHELDLSPFLGRYRLNFSADVLSPDHRSSVNVTTWTRDFGVWYRPAPEPDPTLAVSFPSDGYRQPLGRDLPVFARINGLQPYDRLVIKLLRDGTEITDRVVYFNRDEYNPAKTVMTELEAYTVGSIVPEAEGDYQVVVEHHNAEGVLVNSETKNIYLYYTEIWRDFCTTSSPVHITDLHGIGGPLEVGRRMSISYCRKALHSNPHIRIVLKNGPTDGEWVVIERHSTPTTGGRLEWEIPSDVPPGDNYSLQIELLEDSAFSQFRRRFRIHRRQREMRY